MTPGRTNNFGSLRLLFATLVIVSHSPELIDGNRSREVLTMLFGTMSFGEAAVDGFFLISGYLITQSFERRGSTIAYLINRILRIVPAYLMSFVLCILLIAPFVGGHAALTLHGLALAGAQMLTLNPPEVPGVFPGAYYPLLNGAMWTIAYEFRCYLATAVLGLVGIYKMKYRTLLLIPLMILLYLNASEAIHTVTPYHKLLLGVPEYNIRFAALYGVGAAFYLFRDKIPLTNIGAAVSAGLLAGLMFNRQLAETSYAVFGGYLIFWVAFKLPVLRLSRFDNAADISYGLYLYGWPLQSLIVWHNPDIAPWQLCPLSLLLAGAAGYASWILVEKPSLGHKRSGATDQVARALPAPLRPGPQRAR